MEVSKVRDLTLIKIDKNKTMVVACDSCGSVGMKEGDSLKVNPFYTGKYTARAALLEVLCTGAEIVTVVDAICNEMKSTGEKIIRGIEEELNAAGISRVVLTGSTEENFPTVSTALGITVIGIAETKVLKVNSVKDNSIVVSIGLPKVGEEVKVNNDEDIVHYSDIEILLNTKDVYEIIPVGSKGILNEACQLAKNNGMKLKIEENINVDIMKSAGPSTVIIAAVSDKVMDNIKHLRNFNIIGSIIK
ncbi:AIR synthase related protein [Clostridium sp.]|uniref:AIR synthase related protein n=1 Tax=Clostridium sp. TaxID=1506 RepID=UPI001A51E52A|nr:AIR synthase related protein [Clostridium sp.]MBK5242658.1 alpha-ribazole-5-phosphate synthase [Clostridium sp.]